MADLRHLVQKDTFQDDPQFSDQLLLPSVALGHSVTLVTAFAPSYLYRLVGDLASSPELEPGKLNLVFCVPSSLGTGLSKARLLSRFLSAFAENAQEVKVALESMLQLAGEGGLTLSALYSSDSKLLTPSCIGIIESGTLGSNDYLGFVDVTAGDLNSPIDITASWDADKGSLTEITQTVLSAKNSEFSHLERVTHSDVVSLLNEILKGGYPKKDIGARDRGRVKPANASSEKTPVRTRKSWDDEGPKDWEIFAIEDELSFEDQEFLSLIRRVEGSGSKASDYVHAFLGENEWELNDLYLDLDDSKRKHVAPLPSFIAGMVGHGYSECWCGEMFDRGTGCPSYYS